MTVLGLVKVDSLGIILPHEHITTNFIGADQIKEPPYTTDNAVTIILPHLQKLKAQGVDAIFECTPKYIGRDVRLLKRLSELSGIHIITNTGLYAAVDKKYLPDNFQFLSVDSLVAMWENEWRSGIDETGIRPGFIKLGVGQGAIDEIEQTLLQAAIQISKTYDLTIAMHTGNDDAARSEYEMMVGAGISPSKMIWVHAQNGTDAARVDLAISGVWISLDGVSEGRLESYVDMISVLKSNNLLHRLLLSHDYGWSVALSEVDSTHVELVPFDNGSDKPYQTIFTGLIPRLKEMGFTASELEQIMIKNPKLAYAIRH